MVTVRSNGFSAQVEYHEGLTASQALESAGLRKKWGHKVHVGNEVVGPTQQLKDGDTVTVAPKIKNG